MSFLRPINDTTLRLIQSGRTVPLNSSFYIKAVNKLNNEAAKAP
jgi:hypothetical protein